MNRLTRSQSPKANQISTPVELRIYGKSARSKSSSIKFNNLSKSTEISVEGLKNCASTSGTVISQITQVKGKKPSHSSQTERSVNLTQPLKNGLIFAIVLPNLSDKEKNEIKQPVLIKLKESDLEEFGFELPFSSYLDRKMNCFKLKIGPFYFSAEIIATGDSPLNLRVCLQENISSNSRWKDLPKMKRLSSGVTSLQHCPLASEHAISPKRVLSKQEIDKLFSCNAQVNGSDEVNEDSQENDNVQDSRTFDSDKICELDNLSTDENSDTNSSSKDEKESSKIKDQINDRKSKDLEKKTSKSRKRKKDVDSVDKSAMEVAMDSINDQVNDLIKRKKSLSEYDTVGSFLISIIDALNDVRQYIDLKNQYAVDISNCVPEKHLTYKISQKNQIYLEGTIRLDLDLYNEAIRNSTPSKAPSFAYQIIKIAFPTEYYEKVTLGKKVINKKEMERYLNVDPNCEKTKYPLSFVWGFEKPYSARMQGKFDYQLGQQRLRAFINHIFRKAKIYQYSAAAEYNVRSRIIKELCSKNTNMIKEGSKNREKESDVEDSEDQSSNASEDQINNAWDIDAFES